tara:strand:- start:28 stop:450 length:423 start_codon:yes stop_codon:yes gene_type:complete
MIDKQSVMKDNVKKYLDKVVNQMVSETEVLGVDARRLSPATLRRAMDDGERIFIMTPFYDGVFTVDAFIEMNKELQTIKFFPINKLTHNFSSHVENIYGLSREEAPYALGKYIRDIIGLLKIIGSGADHWKKERIRKGLL